MRLLNTKTKLLKEFQGEVPEYAILSHTWGEDEVLYSDLEEPLSLGKKGWRKVNKCCEVAASDGWEWVWIDTCCIDKTSSAELSEAINSMFRWYRESSVCFTYLGDFDSQSSQEKRSEELQRSRWWKRGWTLQELIAPRLLLFFDRNWVEFGSKVSLTFDILNITGISRSDIQDYRSCSIAQRMSWASGRETTRPEDIAYCLMGLFDINMPILYGEGTKAFQRLQTEILQSSDDDSILAWTDTKMRSDDDPEFCLAPHPEAFARAGLVRISTEQRKRRGTAMNDQYNGPRCSMSNIGLSLELQCIDREQDPHVRFARPVFDCVALLHCTYGTDGLPIALLLDKVGGLFQRSTRRGRQAIIMPFNPSQYFNPGIQAHVRRITLRNDSPVASAEENFEKSVEWLSFEGPSNIRIRSAHHLRFDTTPAFSWSLLIEDTSFPLPRLSFRNGEQLLIIFVTKHISSQEPYMLILSVFLTGIPGIALGLCHYDGIEDLYEIGDRFYDEEKSSNQAFDHTAKLPLAHNGGMVVAKARPWPLDTDKGSEYRSRRGYHTKIFISIE